MTLFSFSRWIKTTARGKQLTSLDHTIREGNSINQLQDTLHPLTNRVMM